MLIIWSLSYHITLVYSTTGNGAVGGANIGIESCTVVGVREAWLPVTRVIDRSIRVP